MYLWHSKNDPSRTIKETKVLYRENQQLITGRIMFEIKNKNRVRDFLFGGVALLVMGIDALFEKKSFITLNPVTLTRNPVMYWIIVLLQLGGGVYLLYIGIKMQMQKRNQIINKYKENKE